MRTTLSTLRVKHRWVAPLPLILVGLVLVGALAACNSGSGTPTPPPVTEEPDPPVVEEPEDDGTFLIRGLGLAAGAVPAVVLNPVVDGTPDTSRVVTGATVTLDGVTLPFHEASGQYRGARPVAPAPGATLELKVLVDGAEIVGSALVPHAPTLTFPREGEHFLPEDPIEIHWSSVSDPSRYAVFLQSSEAMAWHHELDGSARSTTLSAAALDLMPSDGTTIRYAVRAIHTGAFTGPFHANSTLSLEAESEFRTFTRAPAPPSLTYYVQGRSMSAYWQNVFVYLARNDVPDTSEGLTDLTGAVNGHPLAYNAAIGSYRVRLPVALAPGDALDLTLSGPHGAVTATGEVPPLPALTSPAADASVRAGSDVTVTWTISASPDAFRLMLEGPGGAPVWAPTLAGAARSHTFTADQLPGSGTFTIFLVAVDDGAFGGSHAPGSVMGIVSEAPARSFTLTP